MEAELFFQPPGVVPIPALADADGQGYMVAGGISRNINIAPSGVVGGAYTAAQTIGSLMSITGAARAVGLGSGMIYGATIQDPSRNTGQVDLVFFNASPTNSTVTDKAEFVLSALDAAKVVGNIHVADWTVYGATTGSSLGNAGNSGLVYVLGKTGAVVNTTLFCVAVARAALTLPAAPPSWSVSFKLLPD